jgi:hypothetical protein
MFFGSHPQRQAGLLISNAVISAPGLTLVSQSTTGNFLVTGRLSGFVENTAYPITVTVTWSDGTVTVRTANLQA